MKRYFNIILVCICLIMFVACGDENDYTISKQETEKTIVQTEKMESTEETLTSYTYIDLNQTMYAKESVNIRNLPNIDGENIGCLSFGEEVIVTGQCNETSWYRIDYEGDIAFVSNQYLVSENPIIEITTTQTVTNNSINTENISISSENNQNNEKSVTIPEKEENIGNLVWIPVNGGTKYHNKSSCSNMKNPIQVSVETAIENGYEPCKKCFG